MRKKIANVLNFGSREVIICQWGKMSQNITAKYKFIFWANSVSFDFGV